MRVRPLAAITACILCDGGPLTEEHVFPDAVGGDLKADLLCERCNGALGKFIDRPYVEQVHVQLARNANQIGGRRNNVPQPFAGPHDMKTPDGVARVVLDEDWQPRLLPTPPEVEVLPDGSLRVSAGADAADREQLASMLETKVRRYFNSPEGLALQWSQESITAGIEKLKRSAREAPSTPLPVSADLHVREELSFKVGFLEHVKVAYEIACLHGGDAFARSGRAAIIRPFLLENIQADIRDTWDLAATAQALGTLPLPAEARDALASELRVELPNYHVVVLMDASIIVCMLSMGIVLVESPPPTFRTIYLNDIKTQTCEMRRG